MTKIVFLMIMIPIIAFSKNYDEYFIEAQEQAKQKKYSLAIKNYKQALALTRQFRNLARSKYEIAMCYYKLKNYQQAAKFFIAVRKSSRALPYLVYRAGTGLGYCYYFQKKYELAIKIFKGQLTTMPKHSRSYFFKAALYIGKSYYCQKKYPEALEVFQNLAQKTEFTPSWRTEAIMNGASCFSYQKNYQKAIDELLKITKITGVKKSELHKMNKRIAICFYRLKNYTQSQKTIQQILSDSKNLHPYMHCEILLYQGLNYYFLKNYSASRDSFNKLLEISKKSALAGKNFGKTALKYLNKIKSK
jgi:tetratricopeptide (TPR) repeat protein